MRAGSKILVAVLLVAGCDERQVRAPAAPPAVMVVDASVAPALLGVRPATLGPAFDGLALGQEIDRHAADQFLKEHGIPATALVRDGHLVSLRLALRGSVNQWPSSDDDGWLDVTLHQHATADVTELGIFLQFDLEVPIEQWMNTTLPSIVRFDFVSTSLDEVDAHLDLPPRTSNDVDGRAHVSWTDSALAGAVSTTHLSVQEVQALRRTRSTGDGGWEVEEIPGARSHELHVSLDVPPAIYGAIEQRLTDLFGKPDRDRKANTESWKRKKLVLSRTAKTAGLEHIELAWER